MTMLARTVSSQNNGHQQVRPLLEVEGLEKRFPVRSNGILQRQIGAVHAVSDLSLSVYRGETVGLVGESGSGKSTLARLVLRLIEPTQGSVRFGGEDILATKRRDLRAFRQRAQMVFQDPYTSFDPMSSVFDSVAEPLRTHHGMRAEAARDRVVELFSLIGLSPAFLDRRPAELSGGQLQRAGIGRALVVDPDLLVLDEPVSALDVSTQAQVINLLRDLKEKLEIAYLFIAHDLAIVRHVSDRIAVMYLGRLVEIGPAEGVYEQPTHPYTKALLSAIPIPDPVVQKTRERVTLSGDIPSPLNPPSGCRFRTRCPSVMDICSREVPSFIEAPHGGTVACHLYSA